MPPPPVFTISSVLGGNRWCAVFQIVDDTERESVREEFTVSLMALDGPVTISAVQESATVTIVDDDGSKFLYVILYIEGCTPGNYPE